MFYTSKSFHRSTLPTTAPFQFSERVLDENLAYPIDLDTEYFTAAPNAVLAGEASGETTTVTYQARAAFDPAAPAKIWTGSDFAGMLDAGGYDVRHDTPKHPFIFADYLETVGHAVKVERDERLGKFHKDHEKAPKAPTLTFVIYAHYAIADLRRSIVDSAYQQDIDAAFKSKRLEMGRRLTTAFGHPLKMPWLITVDGARYQVGLKIVDSCALHGVAGLKDLGETVGLAMKDKGALDDLKHDMGRAYVERPDVFDAYAVGDLVVSQIVELNDACFKTIYEEMGLAKYWQPAKLTIGSTVYGLFESSVHQFLDFWDAETVADHLTGASAAYYKDLPFSTAHLLGKVEGGRCVSNFPLVYRMIGKLCDIDLAGCYASSMSVQPFTMGHPVSFGSRNIMGERENFKGVPLRKLLKILKSELVAGTWIMRINALGLSFDQDFLTSWIDHFAHSTRDVDGVVTGVADDYTSGTSKIFLRQILNGVLTSALLEVIENLPNKKQAADLLDKIMVTAGAFYPASCRVSKEGLLYQDGLAPENRLRFCAKKQAALTKLGFEVYLDKPHHGQAWTSVPLGELFTDVVRNNRAKYPKKTPMNTFYKLIANTIYGDMVSRFFDFSNCIVANNITGTVRAAMYCIEKALNLAGSITDGQIFNLDNVYGGAVGGRAQRSDLFATMNQIPERVLHDAKQKFCVLPMPEAERDVINRLFAGDSSLQYEAEKIVNVRSMEHVRKIWPNISFLNAKFKKPVFGEVLTYTEGVGIFDFEMKCFAKKALFHGSSNYRLDDLDPKMRGYESNKPHFAYTLEGGELVELEGYYTRSPAHKLFEQLEADAERCELLAPFAKQAMLKPNEFSNVWESRWQWAYIGVGDSFIKTGCPSYFSLAQYKYNTRDQYTAWKKASERLKRQHGMGFEIYFLNVDGTLNYKRMIETLNGMIADGETNPKGALDKNRNNARTLPAIVLEIKQAKAALAMDSKRAFYFDDEEEAA